MFDSIEKDKKDLKALLNVFLKNGHFFVFRGFLDLKSTYFAVGTWILQKNAYVN